MTTRSLPANKIDTADSCFTCTSYSHKTDNISIFSSELTENLLHNVKYLVGQVASTVFFPLNKTRSGVRRPTSFHEEKTTFSRPRKSPNPGTPARVFFSEKLGSNGARTLVSAVCSCTPNHPS